ncbi:hypothetical protein B0H15DRAFT_804257 [Mycena belliarum]|uniref:Uncharacterized protein n=1 Tax=Mycena belliarum TaxID=1033014 RepID=A0AAD6XLS5_9AGAR|nr:hypothetical protein B0H15DRAFT_804257 [Mycena belliae]
MAGRSISFSSSFALWVRAPGPSSRDGKKKNGRKETRQTHAPQTFKYKPLFEDLALLAATKANMIPKGFPSTTRGQVPTTARTKGMVHYAPTDRERCMDVFGVQKIPNRFSARFRGGATSLGTKNGALRDRFLRRAGSAVVGGKASGARTGWLRSVGGEQLAVRVVIPKASACLELSGSFIRIGIACGVAAEPRPTKLLDSRMSKEFVLADVNSQIPRREASISRDYLPTVSAEFGGGQSGAGKDVGGGAEAGWIRL